MNRVTIMVSAMALAALSGCGKSEDKAASGAPQAAEDVAEEMSKVKLEPGLWEYTHEIIDVTMEGLPKEAPAGMVDQMIAGMKGKKTTTQTCLTPEEAENPGAKFMAGQKDASCTYSNFDMSGGKVSGVITCSDPQGQGKMTMTMQGSYSATSYENDFSMDANGMGAPGSQMKMTMKAHGSGKRVGECTGKEQDAEKDAG